MEVHLRFSGQIQAWAIGGPRDGKPASGSYTGTDGCARSATDDSADEGTQNGSAGGVTGGVSGLIWALAWTTRRW